MRMETMENKDESRDFTESFSSVLDLIRSGEMPAAESLLSKIAHVGRPLRTKAIRPLAVAARELTPKPLRHPVPIEEQAIVFARDRYTCRYCGRKTISLQVMMAVHELYPVTYLLHKNWKLSETDRSFSDISASLEHKIPVKRGGTNERDNLLTSCAWCNYSKGDALVTEIGWSVMPISEQRWDGLSGSLEALVTLLQPARGSYTRWIRAIKAASIQL